MAENRRSTDNEGTGVKLDLTVNIPTILLIISMVSGSIVYINTQVTNVNNAQLTSAGDIRLLQAQTADNATATANLRADTATQMNIFRSEVRGDIRDLKISVENALTKNNRG